ncbi:MAG: hypothetical protein HRU18_02635 [Pseudoalteromonas sp.]|uniref:hypothetical protein n=1 Tax=Pseudoalteromonas sp. TaxID=53249 RepID=UPI001D3F2B10|nr:hypothetical protein [Pseudoalteromonas sp.]NRA77080.1 hypothetical protein [Pseudoalteromonas sp.]
MYLLLQGWVLIDEPSSMYKCYWYDPNVTDVNDMQRTIAVSSAEEEVLHPYRYWDRKEKQHFPSYDAFATIDELVEHLNNE